MIHRHGIGVIELDEGVVLATSTTLLPSNVHMAKVINLRAVRKRVARLQDGQDAAERRARYGVPKAERLLAKARDEKARRDLDDHLIEKGEGR